MRHEASYRAEHQAAFLASLLGEAILRRDTDSVTTVCRDSAALAELAGAPESFHAAFDRGCCERVELLAALAESAGRGESREAHRHLLLHLAGSRYDLATLRPN